jgi:hypothetical protein
VRHCRGRGALKIAADPSYDESAVGFRIFPHHRDARVHREPINNASPNGFAGRARMATQ